MNIGHANYRKPDELTLAKIIILPFIAVTGAYDIRGRGRDPEKRL